MTNDNSQRPAFPGYTLRENASGAKIYDSHIGLTKREYFAGLALQGLLSDRDAYIHKVAELPGLAVALADDLLRELYK